MDTAVGRELTASELLPQSVVVLDVGSNLPLITMSVVKVWRRYVEFHSRASDVALVAQRSDNDVLSWRVGWAPDHPLQVHVYEYLGREM